MIDNTEFSIHKFETKLFESIFDLKGNSIAHLDKNGDLAVTLLKYSFNTSEIKALKTFKTEFPAPEVKNAKFFHIEVFNENPVLIKEHSEIMLIEKENTYYIYEVFFYAEKKSELLFELAKKNLNKVLGYHKVFLGSKVKLYFLFFEVNYSFMVFESNNKVIEISDKKVNLYTLSYFEGSLFLCVLYESNQLEIYQYNKDIAQTANMSKFKKILELNLMSKKNIRSVKLLSFRNFLVLIGTNNNIFIYEIIKRKDTFMISLFSYLLNDKGESLDNTIVQASLLSFPLVPYADVLFVFVLNDDVLRIQFMDLLQSKKLGTLETIKLDKPVSTFSVFRIGLTEFVLVFTEFFSKEVYFVNYDIGIYLNSHDYTFNNYKYNSFYRQSYLYQDHEFDIEYEKIEEQFNKKIEAVTFNKKVKSSGYGKPNENMKYLSKKKPSTVINAQVKLDKVSHFL